MSHEVFTDELSQGWVNLLLVSSNGPIKIPVGACATALQSLEIACDTIRSGKAKVMFAGGFDDFSEEGSYEFANMKATSNTETEFASGREPNEMSRPTTSTRAGFMESQGCGVQVLMSAKTAVEMGASICKRCFLVGRCSILTFPLQMVSLATPAQLQTRLVAVFLRLAVVF